MSDWIQHNELLLGWLAGLSILTFFGSIAVVSLLVIRIPADYFARPEQRGRPWPDHHPLLRLLLVFAKNLLGMILLVAGIIMLVLPGQGLLTMLLGITLLDFPGKYRAERWFIGRTAVLRSVNWLRRRRGAPPLSLG